MRYRVDVSAVPATIFLLALGCCSHALARQCEELWLKGGGLAGTNARVNAAEIYDPDGAGPGVTKIVIGGEFTLAGSSLVSFIAEWDGSAWSGLSGGVNGFVRDIKAFDPDGSGPAGERVIVAGDFTIAGGMPAGRLAIWDGAAWQYLGLGMDGPVEAVAWFDPDDDGPQPGAVVAGGRFVNADGMPASRLSIWQNDQWTQLGGGLGTDACPDPAVMAMCLHDPDGTDGPLPSVLVVAGRFRSAGGTQLNCIGAWNGTAWSSFGSGIVLPCQWSYQTFLAVTSCDFDGPGGNPPWLFAGGESLANVGGAINSNLVQWNGVAWSIPGTGIGATKVEHLSVYDPYGDGSFGPRVIAAGNFTSAGGVDSQDIAQWTGGGWLGFAGGLASGPVYDVVTLPAPGSDSPAIIAVGQIFAAPPAVPMSLANVAWFQEGSGWSAFTSEPGVGDPNQQVYRLATWDSDGSGPAVEQLAAVGDFGSAGGQTAARLAVWNGSTWSSVGNTTTDVTLPLTCAAFDPPGDGSDSQRLVVAGEFNTVWNGVAAQNVAQWNGTAWSALGDGVWIDVTWAAFPVAKASVSFDPDGPGPMSARLIVAGGLRRAGSVQASRIAQWDGSIWSALGAGVSTFNFEDRFDGVHDLAVLGENTPSPLLVVGGNFDVAGGESASNIAVWNGQNSTWAALGSGCSGPVGAVAAFDPDGAGPQPLNIVAGGGFLSAGGLTVNGIARWNPETSQWSALGTGVSGGGVLALAAHDPDGEIGSQPAVLVAAGSFTSAGGTPANRIAYWDGANWHPMGAGLNGQVNSLTSHDPDGAGVARNWLVAGGNFTSADGKPAANFAVWAATTNVWKQPVSAVFTTASAWICNRAPSAFEFTSFDAVQAGYSPSSFTVTMPDGSGPIQARSLTSRTDTVTINLRNRPFQLTSGSTTIADPALIIGELPDYAASLTIRNTLGLPAALEVGSAVMADVMTDGQKINQLRVQDPNAQVHIEGDLYAGRRGNTGQFIVQGQADASVGGAISVGTNPGARGMVAVYNSGSTLTHSTEGRSMAVGQGGIGEWLVGGAGSLAGAQVSSIGRMDTITFGTLPTGNGYANINGSNSKWELRCQDFFIGYTGTGSARIEAGGLLDTDTFGELVISKWPGSFGTVTVTGAGSKWIERSTAITIGSNGILRVLSGGIVEALAVNVLPGGQLLGDGQIGTPGMEFLSDVFNLGDVNPGGDPDAFDEIGSLTIEGNYFQFAPPPGGGPSDSGRLQIDLAGPSPAERDHLTVTGLVQLGGMLKLNLVNGYDPQAGSPPVELLSAALVVGRFDVIEAPGFVPDVNGMVRTMRLDYGTVRTEGVGSISLEIINIQDLFNLEGAPEQGVPGLPARSVVGDFDGFIDPDGNTTLDLAISIPDSADPANAPGTVLILRNAGTIGGVWQGFALPQAIVTVGADPRGLAAADFTGDGDLDIAVANFGSDTVSMLSDLELPLPSVSTFAVGAEPKAVAAGPIDAGNTPDIVVANSGADTATVHLNNGSGVFTLAETLPTGDEPSGIALAPMEGVATADGDLDIVLTNRGDDTVMVFINDVQIGSAFPTPPIVIPVGPAPDPILPGDLDNDKDLDIVNLDTGDAMLSIILNNGDGTFAPSVQLGSPAVGLNPASLTLINLDEDPSDPDADLDIAFICDNEDSTERVIRILRNDRDPQTGQLVFAPYLDQAEGTDPVLIGAGDLDNNGEDDLVTITENSAMMQQQMQGMRRRDARAWATAHRPAEYHELLGPKPTIASALLSSPVKPPPACPGDANGDNVIDSTDLNIILTDFGCAIPPQVSCPGDLDADDDTDSTDLNIVLTVFGTSCE